MPLVNGAGNEIYKFYNGPSGPSATIYETGNDPSDDGLLRFVFDDTGLDYILTYTNVNDIGGYSTTGNALDSVARGTTTVYLDPSILTTANANQLWSVGTAYYHSTSLEDFALELPQGFTTATPTVTASGLTYGATQTGKVEYRILNSLGQQVGIIQFTSFNNLAVGGGQNVTNTCFTAGNKILCADDQMVPVENIAEGTLVMTRDHGLQPVKYILKALVSSETLRQFPDRRPVKIKKNTFGEHDECIVSQQHKVLLQNSSLEILYDIPEALVPAKHLTGDKNVEIVDDCEEIVYYHLVFDNHEVVNSGGLWSESFHPGRFVVNNAMDSTYKELVDIFPEIESGGNPNMILCRPKLNAKEAMSVL